MSFNRHFQEAIGILKLFFNVGHDYLGAWSQSQNRSAPILQAKSFKSPNSGYRRWQIQCHEYRECLYDKKGNSTQRGWSQFSHLRVIRARTNEPKVYREDVPE